MIRNIAKLRSNTAFAKSAPVRSPKTGSCANKRNKKNTLKSLVLRNMGRSAFVLSSILAFSSLSVYGVAENLSKAAEKENAVGVVTNVRGKGSSSMWGGDEQTATAELEADEPDSDVFAPIVVAYIGGPVLLYIFYAAAKKRCNRKGNENNGQL